jgi:hypothetical protein
MGSRGKGWFAVAALSALCSTAAAENKELEEKIAGYRQLLKFALPDDVAKFVASSLSDDFKQELVGEPVSAYHFADAIATYARPTMRRAPEAATATLDWTLDLGQKVVEASPENTSARWAKASALVARARMSLEKHGKVPTDDWSAAAELVLQGAKEGGRAPAIAVGYLVEAADVPGADRAALLAAADRALSDVGTDERSAVAKALVAFGRAKAAPAKGKPFVEQAVATLAPFVAKDSPDLDAATLHNAIVNFARASKIQLKADFRTKKRKSVGLSFEIPVSRTWEDPNTDDFGRLLEQLEKGNFRYFGAYRQYDASGNLVRSIRFDEYNWDTSYRFENGEVAGGDNIKGLARKGQSNVRQEFTSVTTEKDVRKIPFNRTWPQAYVFEIAGIHGTGDAARARLFLFKSNDKQKTYEVEIFEYGKEAKLDPEAQAFLESISEEK